jgi:hypothetical protein
MTPKNSIWYVDTDSGTLTIIAMTSEQARELAADYLDTTPDADELRCPLASTHWPPEHWREVGYESQSDADAMIAEIQRAGVDPSRIRRRFSCTALGEALLWEVVARDVDWCRLPAQVLSGGAE